MAPINKEWHKQNKMPKNPQPEQRIAWHLEHARYCRCRAIPDSVVKLMKERGIKSPK